jgi:DNA-3-methyladenine glycosylase
MQGAPGTVYIYRSYGIHWMFNVVAHEPGSRGAVLIRALEPVEGILLMSRRRGIEAIPSLCSGPGKLCQAMAFDMTHDGIDLIHSPNLEIRTSCAASSLTIARGPRIGISKARDLPLRFYVPNNQHVSGPRRRDLDRAAVLPSI